MKEKSQRKSRFGLGVLFVLGVAACLALLAFFALRPPAESRRGATSPGSSPEAELMLYCGAGIRPAASALIEAFERKHNVRVNATYAGSGRLLGQIVSLQKGDLFMPGAAPYVATAVEKGLAFGETERVVAYAVPVIFVRNGNPKGIRSLRDLGRKGIRLGFGDERSCAIGRSTLKILARNKIAYSDLADNVVYKSGTVNELGLAIQLGNADAVIVWDVNARHFAEYGEIVAIPPEENVPSTIPIVMLKSSRHVEEARRFIDFVTSQEGRRILTDAGYAVTLPGGESPTPQARPQEKE